MNFHYVGIPYAKKSSTGLKILEFLLLIFPFNKYLLSNYYVAATMLSSEGIAVNKIDKNPYLFFFLAGKEKLNDTYTK